MVTGGRIRWREGAETPFVRIRKRWSCTGNCREDEEDRFEEDEDEEEEEAKRVVRSELREGIGDAVTETAIWIWSHKFLTRLFV